MEKKPHIIIFPTPYQGHINPSIQLTLKLASKGFTITFVNTHHTHDQIIKARKHIKNERDDDIFAGARESGLDIRYRTISDGFPVTFDRSLNREQFVMGRIHVFPAHVDELVGQLMGSSHPPQCLIADTFTMWGSAISRKYGLVLVTFWTQPALVFMLYYHLDLLKKHGHFGSTGNRNKDIIDYIPGVPSLKPGDLMSFLQETNISTPMNQIIHKTFEDVKKTELILCNTMEQLEPEPLSMLKQIHPTYAIGPLFPPNFVNRSVEMNLWSESDCTHWLDTKPPGSILYASFGSYAHSNKDDICTVANGLMLSGFSFIWVLRPDVVCSDIKDILPSGFKENVGNRGLVVQWCKQNMVLSHSAVGGFFTHCGWNSILESIWCGIPMICFPLVADQPTNRKMVVEDWKIGIDLTCGGKLVSSEEIAKRIKMLMSGEVSNELRNRVEEYRKKLECALARNGSSQVNFDKFVEDLKAKIERN